MWSGRVGAGGGEVVVSEIFFWSKNPFFFGWGETKN